IRHRNVTGVQTCALPISLMKQLKGGSSYRINRVLERTGPLWQHESFDHILRSDETLRMKTDYICDNPVRAGLVQSSSEYRWLWRSEERRVGKSVEWGGRR